MKKSLSLYTFYYIISLVLMRICGILAKIFMARSITPYEYGMITLFVLVLPGIFQFITNFCFFDILGHATEGKKYFSFALIYGTVSTAIIAIIIFLFPAPFFNFLNIPPIFWNPLLLVVVGVLFAVTIGGNITGILRGVRNHSLAASFSTAPSILRVLFIIIAIYILGINDFYVILVIFALPSIIVLLPVIIIKRKTILSSFQSIFIPTKGMMVFGFSFFILNIWMSLIQNFNSIIISHDLGISWQGYYDVSLSMVAVITFFSTAIYMISGPETTVKDNRSEILLKRGGFGDIGKILFSICLFCVVIIYFYSYQLTTLLFTEKYTIASEFLVIFTIGYAILFIQQYVAFLNISGDSEKGISRLSLVTVVSIVIYPFFTHFMILYYNFMGAYLSTTIFIIFYTLATIVLIKDRTPLRLLLTKIDRLVLSVFGTCLINYLIHFSLVPGILVSLGVFSILIISLGYVDRDQVLDMLRLKS